ncbi:MAG: cytochrome c oxidase subunit II [Polyangiales bacterium]
MMMLAPKIDIDSFWLPKQSSTFAPQVDNAWNTVMIVCTVFFFLLMIPTFYFVWKYKRKKEGEVTSAIDHNTQIEIVWTLIPGVILIVLFFVGLAPWVNASVAPANALEVQVTAQKWNWSFRYANGTTSPGKLVVPKGKPVRLILSATDVLHSFYVAEFRVKADAIPGQYTSLWFEATNNGDYTVQCAEYCGGPAGDVAADQPGGHSDMRAEVTVMDEGKFKEWLETGGEDKSLPPAERGKQMYAKWGCQTCHSLDGTKLTGPSFKGLFGREEELADGSKVKVDENYIRESVLNPTAKVVKGFAPVMPVFQGQIKDQQIDNIIAFIKEQK